MGVGSLFGVIEVFCDYKVVIAAQVNILNPFNCIL